MKTPESRAALRRSLRDERYDAIRAVFEEDETALDAFIAKGDYAG